MKRFRLVFVALGMIMASSAFALEWSITNVFGGDADKLWSEDDLINYTRNEEGVLENAKGMEISDRLQFDLNSYRLDGRVRLDGTSTSVQDLFKNLGTEGGANVEELATMDTLMFRIRGYASFRPLNWLYLVAGNKFFNKYALKFANLAATDDTPKSGKMIRDGYGLVMDFKMGPEEKIYLDLSASMGVDFNPADTSTLELNAGLDFGCKDLVGFGVTGQNLLSENRKLAAFIGTDILPALTLNLGFSYNFTDEDFLDKETLYAVSASAGFNFGLADAYVDVITGLNSQYRTSEGIQEYENGAIPYMIAARTDFFLNKNWTIGLKFDYRGNWNCVNEDTMVFYPSVQYGVPRLNAYVKGGVRVGMDKDGIYKITVPASFRIKLGGKI